MPNAELDAFESKLLAEGIVSEVQLARARRVSAHLKQPKSPVEILVSTGQLARSEYERVLRVHQATLSLDEILVANRALDPEGRAAYQLARSQNPDGSEREVLVGRRLVTEAQFMNAVSLKHDLPIVEPDAGLVDPALLADVSVPYLVRNRVLPLRVADEELSVAMSDPLDVACVAELERIYRMPVRPCLAAEEKIVATLKTVERLRDGHVPAAGTTLQYREIRETTSDDPSGRGAIGILDDLLMRAIQMRASDLHVEPLERTVRVRVRVDGVMQTLTGLPAAFAPQLISRIKVLADADIAERRLHQDGRFRVKLDGGEIDIRVSTYASMFGETAVLRLLDRRRGLVSLEDLGFEARPLSMLRDVVLRANAGCILVTGPTGSGKTTTLYSFVDYVNDPGIKVISAEDPVEYMIPGVAQCSINSKTGPTFAQSLRAIVRQDPDIIVVGEIRDGETAALAVEAALTGHQVFSTLHTEDAVGALIRLIDLGVEPYLVSSTISAIVAQRLVRRVCPNCTSPVEPLREDLRYLDIERADLAGLSLMAGRGCANCNGTGYKGRVAIHEVLVPSDDLRDAVLRRAASRELRSLARHLPVFSTLQESGVMRALQGDTSLSEIVANAPRDPDARRPTVLLELIRSGGPR
ncbi:MAG: type II/IV secretion system protein [Candidatus Eisenbacteria bacterium]|uniref:Type II/IV secretion system protein n=1 Tax=Eiseniibacteriota bacterium TaxID=2212470 RepID=A0A849SFQ2_UNCEI|nr:type II/IV secretion system protein [Candidatus Eisenbacteria bacterium]